MSRLRNCLAQLYAKDITPNEKQELDEALQREVNAFLKSVLVYPKYRLFYTVYKPSFLFMLCSPET